MRIGSYWMSTEKVAWCAVTLVLLVLAVAWSVWPLLAWLAGAYVLMAVGVWKRWTERLINEHFSD